MENKGKLLFFVFILLVILGIFGYFYMTKSQIERDFEILYKPYIYADLVYEENWSGYYNYYTSEKIANGTVLAAAIPYFFNNTPYIILISYQRYIPGPGKGPRYYIKVYNPITKEVVDQAMFWGPEELTILNLKIAAYTSGNKKIISFVGESWGWLPASWGIPIKIVVEDAKIKEIKSYVDELTNWIGEDAGIGFFIPLEKDNKSNILVIYEKFNLTEWKFYYYLNVFDESGNILLNKSLPRIIYFSFYESKDYVLIGGIGYNNILIIVYNKENMNISIFEEGNIKTYPTYSDYYPAFTFTKLLFGGYDKNIITAIGTVPIYIFTEKTGVIGLNLNETEANIRTQKAFGGAIFTSDKIMFYSWLFGGQPANVYYWLYNYSTINNMDVSLISKGVFLNIPNLLKEEPNNTYITWGMSEITPLYVYNDTYNIVYSWEEYVPFAIIVEKSNGVVGIYGLVNLDEYKVYPMVFFNNSTYTECLDWNVCYGHRISWTYYYNHYNTMYLSPVICETSFFYNSPDELAENTTCRVYMFYIDLSLISSEKLQLNVTNETNRTQPRPQPGFGIEIMPTPTEINITYPNVTQNVTVTRPTGIQSVIEILRRNIWIILVAILLLILVGTGLKRKAS